jgi:hypothetical protein
MRMGRQRGKGRMLRVRLMRRRRKGDSERHERCSSEEEEDETEGRTEDGHGPRKGCDAQRRKTAASGLTIQNID